MRYIYLHIVYVVAGAQRRSLLIICMELAFAYIIKRYLAAVTTVAVSS